MSQSIFFIKKSTCISPIYNKLQRLSAKVYAVWKANIIHKWRFCLISLYLESNYHFDVQMYMNKGGCPLKKRNYKSAQKFSGHQ